MMLNARSHHILLKLTDTKHDAVTVAMPGCKQTVSLLLWGEGLKHHRVKLAQDALPIIVAHRELIMCPRVSEGTE